MLNNSSWYFSLGLILLTVIYRNVQSKELNEVGDARRNIFMDIKKFFVTIFKPRQTNKQSKGKGNTTNKNKITPTTPNKKKITPTTPKKNKITPTTHKKKKPKKKPAYYVQRRITRAHMRNKNNGFQNNPFQIEDIQKEPGISDIDIISKKKLRAMYFFLDGFGISFNLSQKTHKDQEINLYKRSDDSGENYIKNKRRQKTSNPKTLIIIATNKKKVHEEIIAREGLPYLGQDDLNQTILRQAYGVACIKVAVRKCYKALRRVNDIVCRTLYKCKSSFKSMFLLKAKSGCITGFDYTRISSQKPPEIEIKNNSRALQDLKIVKYLDACIPYMLSEYTVRKQIHLRSNVPQIVRQILRDESDKKCQKLSREACVAACYYARGEVCSTYICSRNKKNAFKRECRNECKSTYAIRTDSSDSGSGSSD